jgi:hypothetical protein
VPVGEEVDRHRLVDDADAAAVMDKVPVADPARGDLTEPEAGGALGVDALEVADGCLAVEEVAWSGACRSKVIAPGPRWVHLVPRVVHRYGGELVGSELRLQLSEDGADVERLDALTGLLRQELLQLDVEDVTRLRAGEAPPGSRAFDVVAVGGLLVSLSRSAEGLRSVVSAIRKWLARGEGTRRTVRLELDGDVLELSEASAADQERLIGLFVSRHTARDAD